MEPKTWFQIAVHVIINCTLHIVVNVTLHVMISCTLYIVLNICAVSNKRILDLQIIQWEWDSRF